MKAQTHPVSVIIPYNRNETGLAFLLGILQAQLVPPEKIVVVDTSDNKSGLAIGRRYYTNTSTVEVVTRKGATIYEAWNEGIERSQGLDMIFLNDDVVVPMNFVDVMAVIAQKIPGYCFVPDTPDREHKQKRITLEFPWYSPIPEFKKSEFSTVEWMPGFAFMLTKQAIKDVGTFDEAFKVWFGDDDYEARLQYKYLETGIPPIIKVNPVYVYHFGGSSYKYNDKDVTDLIAKDRAYFIDKQNMVLNSGKQIPAKKKGDEDGKN